MEDNSLIAISGRLGEFEGRLASLQNEVDHQRVDKHGRHEKLQTEVGLLRIDLQKQDGKLILLDKECLNIKEIIANNTDVMNKVISTLDEVRGTLSNLMTRIVTKDVFLRDAFKIFAWVGGFTLALITFYITYIRYKS